MDDSNSVKLGLEDDGDSKLKPLLQSEYPINNEMDCENDVATELDHENRALVNLSINAEGMQSTSKDIKETNEVHEDLLERDGSVCEDNKECEGRPNDSKGVPDIGIVDEGGCTSPSADVDDIENIVNRPNCDNDNLNTDSRPTDNLEIPEDKIDLKMVEYMEMDETVENVLDRDGNTSKNDDVYESLDEGMGDLKDEIDLQDEISIGLPVHQTVENDSFKKKDVRKRPILESVSDKKSEIKKLSANESAFQRLASLGVIAEDKPVIEESKESALKKLVSRGAISITPAGVGTLTSTLSKAISITPTKPITQQQRTPTRPKIGPKSAMLKQRAKKIKIDPGNSLDIDKDFNSLISFLSTGTDKIKVENSGSSQENNECAMKPKSVQLPHINEAPKPEKLPDVKHETEISIPVYESNADQSMPTDDGIGGTSLDGGLDVSDERSMHETDSESHDGSKSFSHSSDHAEEIDDRINTAYSKHKNVIEEGSAEILLTASKNVFYNKVQEFNRDMSIAALTVFSEMHQQDPRTRNRGQKRKAKDTSDSDINGTDLRSEYLFEPGKKSENGITILEALSATGLRSIRYAREIPGVKEVIANDLSEDAVETIKKNIEHNSVEDLVSTTMSDAALLMYQHTANQEGYDAIDLDPYGCPSRFLDSAVQAVRDGGLLLVTCTDMAVLAGNTPETCYVKYGAVSIRMPACHEMALRISLQCIESHANRYGRYIVPLLSFSADFYIRLIVQVYTSPVTCKKTISKLSMVYQCSGCHTHALQTLGQNSQTGPNTQTKFSLPQGPPVNTHCFHCNRKHHTAGPIWSAPMHNVKFLESMLRVAEKGMFSTAKRMQGMLEVIREELPDAPLYYTIAGLCTKLHCRAIPLIDIRSAILNAGYRVSSSHASATAIKTNAPSKIIWDIMRCWVHMNPVSQKRLLPGSVPANIICEPPQLIANFDIHPKARPSSSLRKLLRYQPNPEKNWGPGTRARCNNEEDLKDDKRRANQNKNKQKKNIDIIEVVTIDDEDEVTEGTAVMETATTSSMSST